MYERGDETEYPQVRVQGKVLSSEVPEVDMYQNSIDARHAQDARDVLLRTFRDVRRHALGSTVYMQL